MVRRLAQREGLALAFGLHGRVCYGCEWRELRVSGRTSCHFSCEAELEWRRRTSLPGENVSPNLFRQASSASPPPRRPLPAPPLGLIAATPCPLANLTVCRQKTTQKISAVVLFKLAVTLTWPLHSLPLRFRTPSSPSQNPVMCFSPLFLSILTLTYLWIPAWKQWLTGQEAFLVWTVVLLRVISGLSRFVSWFH